MPTFGKAPSRKWASEHRKWKYTIHMLVQAAPAAQLGLGSPGGRWGGISPRGCWLSAGGDNRKRTRSGQRRVGLKARPTAGTPALWSCCSEIPFWEHRKLNPAPKGTHGTAVSEMVHMERPFPNGTHGTAYSIQICFLDLILWGEKRIFSNKRNIILNHDVVNIRGVTGAFNKQARCFGIVNSHVNPRGCCVVNNT